MSEMAVFQPMIVATFERLSAALWQDANFAEKKSFVLDKITVEKLWESVKWLGILYNGEFQASPSILAGM